MRSVVVSLAMLGWVLVIQGSVSAEVLLDRAVDGTYVLHNLGGSTPSSGGAKTPGRGPAIAGPPTVELARMIDRQARRNRLDPRLVRAVVAVESGYRPAVVSHKGAIGLMQLMPDTSRALAVSDPLDPEQNLAGGSEYLRRMLDLFGGDLRLALAGYNAGPEAVRRYGGVPPYAETRSYVERVLTLYGGAGGGGRPVFLEQGANGQLTLTTNPTANR